MKNSLQIIQTNEQNYLPIIYFLRGLVFQKEIGHSFVDIEQDYESTTVHFLLKNQNEYLGCLSLVQEDFETLKAHRIRALAIYPKFQHQGLGTILLKAAITYWKQKEKTNILWLSSLEKTILFYQKNKFTCYEQLYLRDIDGWSQKMIMKK